MDKYNILNVRIAFPKFEGDIDCPRKSFSMDVATTLEEIDERMDNILSQVAAYGPDKARLESVTNYSSFVPELISEWAHLVLKKDIPFSKRVRDLRRKLPITVEILYLNKHYKRYCNEQKNKATGKVSDGY
jgi:hypothetical protein